MSVPQLLPRIKAVLLSAALIPCLTTQVCAHASEQGLVLLLPTDLYISSGVAAVVLTVLLLAALPNRAAETMFTSLRLMRVRRSRWHLVVSVFSAALFCGLWVVGMIGSRDPLSNPLVLGIWTVWWVGLVSLQGLFGNIWRWINPWTGPVALLRWLGVRPVLRLPVGLGHSLAVVTFLGFALFLMADIAPADPARLALIAGGYWAFTLIATLVFGPRWLLRAEGVTVLMRSYALMGVFGRRGSKTGLGLWGWKILRKPVPPIGLAAFMLILLGSGSFDGLNETFWWMGVLGINPLEFPGRSAVVTQNALGLLAANAGLLAVFAVTIWAGLRLIRSDMPLSQAFCIFAPSILPIALGYHIAHYYTSFLVQSQYAIAAFNDPFANGADLFGLGTFYVTTGFFSTPDSVRAIFLTQAAAVVIGHVLAVLLAHALAVRHFGTRTRATLSQTPLAVFMTAYTFFGLWLLASPRGV